VKVKENVIKIIRDISGEKSIKTTATLKEDLALDSFSMVRLLVEIEEVFTIELNESDMNPFELTTVQNVIDMVSKYCDGDKR